MLKSSNPRGHSRNSNQVRERGEKVSRGIMGKENRLDLPGQECRANIEQGLNLNRSECAFSTW